MKRTFVQAFESENLEYKCPIENEFHDTIGGCFINAKNEHVYKKIQVFRSRDDKIIPQIFNFNVSYNHRTYIDGMMAWKTALPKKITTIDEMITDEDTFVKFFTQIITDYIFKIHPNLDGELLSPKHLFDIVFDNDKIIQLRPLILSASLLEFICDIRKIFFILFNKMISHFDETEKINLKERNICSVSSFTATRSTPEFNCVSSHESSCPHIATCINETGKIDLNKVPKSFCKFLLKRLINDFGHEMISAKFQFKCQFVHFETFKSNLRFITKVFNRTTFHRLCIPNQFINVEWFRWFLSLFNVELPKHFPDVERKNFSLERNINPQETSDDDDTNDV